MAYVGLGVRQHSEQVRRNRTHGANGSPQGNRDLFNQAIRVRWSLLEHHRHVRDELGDRDRQGLREGKEVLKLRSLPAVRPLGNGVLVDSDAHGQLALQDPITGHEAAKTSSEFFFGRRHATSTEKCGQIPSGPQDTVAVAVMSTEKCALRALPSRRSQRTGHNRGCASAIPARVLMDMASELQPTCVISLVIRRPDRPEEMLMGVRAETPTSARHPNVLSTPTMRIPQSALEAIIGEHPAALGYPMDVGTVAPLSAAPAVEFGGAQALATTTAFLVESSLSRKLGSSDLLVTGELHGRATPAAIAVDVVPDPATGLDELTHMLTVVVDLDQGWDQIPGATPSYSELLWVPRDRLADALEHNDVLRLVPHIDLMVCLYGLCVRSAAYVTSLDRRMSSGPGEGR